MQRLFTIALALLAVAFVFGCATARTYDYEPFRPELVPYMEPHF